MSSPVIQTERLVLRAPVLHDLDRCAALLGDYEVAKMLSRVPYPYDREAGKTSLQNAVTNWIEPRRANVLSFQIDHNDQMIGSVSFKKLQETPEIGYWLGRPYWGKGFMSGAVTAAISWLFQNTDHSRLASEAMIENQASLKVAKKLGFQVVGEVGCASASRGCIVPAIRTELTRAEFLTGH